MTRLNTTDRKVAKSLRGLTKVRPEYWSYAANVRSANAYTLFQYPAMMVPAMLEDLLGSLTSSDPDVRTVCDPFLGSGSVLTEAMLHGRDFHGTDVNPLALLIAKVKSGPLLPRVMSRQSDVLQQNVALRRCSGIDIDFPGMYKWFTSKALKEITALRRAIRSEDRIWCRRFFWVCLAETVRLSSNSRTSTFKLHIRSKEDLDGRAGLSPLSLFRAILSRNLARYEGLEKALKTKGLLRKGKYIGTVDVQLADCRSCSYALKSDLLITSPPYGDNTTTVPYGQHSFLPLQCIDLVDIDDAADPACLATTRAIDSRSLGGHRENALRDVQPLRSVSAHLDECLWQLRELPSDRAVRVATFSRDLHASVRPIISRLRQDAYMVWVIGNRRVGGLEIPTAGILSDFLQNQGSVHVTTLDRIIPSKRMASRNSVSDTMHREKILVFRNGGAA